MTLIDAQVDPAEELSNLYRRRWQAEHHLRSLKTHLQMDHLHCKTPGMVRKEFYTHLLAYNLIRGIMRDAAAANDVPPPQLSFKGALHSLNAFLGMVIADSHQVSQLYPALLWMASIHRVGNRPDRLEPRLVKRRPKPYKLLQEPRHVARTRLHKKEIGSIKCHSLLTPLFRPGIGSKFMHQKILRLQQDSGRSVDRKNRV